MQICEKNSRSKLVSLFICPSVCPSIHVIRWTRAHLMYSCDTCFFRVYVVCTCEVIQSFLRILSSSLLFSSSCFNLAFSRAWAFISCCEDSSCCVWFRNSACVEKKHLSIFRSFDPCSVVRQMNSVRFVTSPLPQLPAAKCDDQTTSPNLRAVFPPQNCDVADGKDFYKKISQVDCRYSGHEIGRHTITACLLIADCLSSAG